MDIEIGILLVSLLFSYEKKQKINFLLMGLTLSNHTSRRTHEIWPSFLSTLHSYNFMFKSYLLELFL